MDYRDAVKSLRNELGITQTELATALRVNEITVRRWELGKNLPNRSVIAVLIDYARKSGASAECLERLEVSAVDAAKDRLEKKNGSLFTIEHASLSQLIDDASYPIYVCDLETDELLYINHKIEALLDDKASRYIGKKCYAALMHRDTPCPHCHKKDLVDERFTTFQAFSPLDNGYHLVQGKRIRWNGRQAHVRYVIDKGSAMEATTQSSREAAYDEQLHVRRELAGDAAVVAHYNLTHNTVSDVVGNRESHVNYICAHTLDDLLSQLMSEPFSDEDLKTLESIRDRKAMIQQFYMGRTHIAFRHYVRRMDGVFEGVFDLMQNPVTFDIEAFAQLHDVTDEAMTLEVAKRLFDIDYETITTIDAVTGAAHPYISGHIRDLIAEQTAAKDNFAGLESYLRKYCADEDVDRVIRGTSLPYVKEQLETSAYYHITYSLRAYGKTMYKRAVYTYLDNRRAVILCAMQDLTDLHALENKRRDQLDDALQILQEQSGMNIARYDLNTKTFRGGCDMLRGIGYGSVIEDVPETFIRDGHVAPVSVDDLRAFYADLHRRKASVFHAMLEVEGGAFHWVRVNARLVTGRDGQGDQAIILYQDVDEMREQATVYRRWRHALDQRKPESYTLFRNNLTRGTAYDKVEGSLLRLELLDNTPRSFNDRARSYAGRFVYIDDCDAYLRLMNEENLLANYYRGTHSLSLCYRERVGQGEYRPIRLTAEMAPYPDSSDIELFILYEVCAQPEHIAQEAACGRDTVFADTGVVLVTCDWPSCQFDYDPSIARHIAGRYDERPIWEIFLADKVADTQDVKVLRGLIHDLAMTPECNNATLDVMLRTPGGAKHWFMVNAYKRVGKHGGDMRIVLAILDVNDDRLANEQLRFQAEHDGVTGLYNRAAFLKLVTETVSRGAADAYVLLCGDINDFALFNSRYGREEGDKLLQYAAMRLRGYAEIRNGFAGSLSNGVFAILLPNAPDVLERAEQAVRGYFADYPLSAKVTGRAGACVVADPRMKADTILDRAAIAKDTIKGKYGAWVAVYDEHMNERHIREKSITDRMEGALASGQFDVYMQPQFHHGTGQIVGAEALVRWIDPELGVLPPAAFIPIFEKTGFITQMDAYIWDKTAERISAWMAEGNTPVPISVNISREDLNDPDLCKKFVAIVEKHNIPTSFFRLEITEGVFAEDPRQLASVVEALHGAGFLVEMDDFGSGYSSLNILKDVPVDVLKLDMRFFSETEHPARGGMIINAVLRMSRWLGISVVAEGVETKEQADFLLSVGCPTIQGYLYAKPMPADEFEKLLADGGKRRPIPRNSIDTLLDVRGFWDPSSADSRLFNACIGPAAVFEYHDGAFEIIRMNPRFMALMRLGVHDSKLPARDIAKICERDRPKFKKAVLDAIYTGKDTKVAVTRNAPDGSEQPLHITMRVIAKSEDRALIFGALGA